MLYSSLNNKTLITIASSLLISLNSFSNANANDNTSNTEKGKLLDAIPVETVKKLDTLIVAGGCFWCTESDFEKHPGVVEAVSGYINGTTKNPTYREVSTNRTGHYEAVEITFDTTKTDIAELTEYYWATVDPTDPKGQFCDKGSSYKTGLFYQNDQQKEVFEKSLNYLKENKPFSDPVVTEILEAQKFYPAEGYHQDYYKKNMFRYKLYRSGCGRDARIKQLWGNIASKEIGEKKKEK